MNETQIQNRNASENEAKGNAADLGRRQLIERLGKFAVYAAPFTVLAFTTKPAKAASCAPGFGSCGGGGGNPTPRTR